ncbi:MAG: type II toxin-antitoxin system VapC family toxin [Candidatus Bathyarchaeota archaeon]|nr:type II toxin-antitoxin system VapC family toxin [Candidatus Bathyarchaeota archaeon]
MESLTFDAEPLVAFFLGEPQAKAVIALLEKVRSGDAEGYINIANLTEVYYAIARRYPDVADEKIESLRTFGLHVVPLDEEGGLWRRAAHLKNRYVLSLGDCFAVATAQTLKSKLVVGCDKQLRGLDLQLIRIGK